MAAWSHNVAGLILFKLQISEHPTLHGIHGRKNFNWSDTHIKDLKIDRQHKSNDWKGSLMNNTEIQIKVRLHCLKVPINIWKQQQTQETNISEPAKPQT